MQRMGFVLGIDPDRIDEYKQIHQEVWPEILEIISRANITNYSIFIHEKARLLFAYWEYVGDDFETDQARLAAEPVMKKWWELCEPMQRPIPERSEGEWWARMEPAFFHP